MLIYAAIAAFGLLFLLVMLVGGDIFGGDHDIGHDFGHDAGIGDHGGPSIFSVRIMASFLTAFGVGGALARYYGLSHLLSSLVGIVTGVVMSGVVLQFAKLLYSQQASSELRMQTLVGTTAEVSVGIPAGGVGQISLNVGGQRSEHVARSTDGRALPRGAVVVITGLGADSVIVTTPGAQPTGGSK
jgi:membrane protein implicated in regulation of membrane protease activity